MDGRLSPDQGGRPARPPAVRRPADPGDLAGEGSAAARPAPELRAQGGAAPGPRDPPAEDGARSPEASRPSTPARRRGTPPPGSSSWRRTRNARTPSCRRGSRASRTRLPCASSRTTCASMVKREGRGPEPPAGDPRPPPYPGRPAPPDPGEARAPAPPGAQRLAPRGDRRGAPARGPRLPGRRRGGGDLRVCFRRRRCLPRFRSVRWGSCRSSPCRSRCPSR